MVIVGIVFHDLLSDDEVPLYRDVLFLMLPFKHFLAQHLRHGEIPLWNPWIYMGTPFAGSFQTSAFYPLNLALLLPFPLGMNLFLFAHYGLALSGTHVFLRSLRLSRTATAIGSLTFVLGGYLVSQLNLINQLQGAIWAPWVLFTWDRFLQRRTPLGFATVVLVLTLQLLSGSVENLLLTVCLVAAWTGHRIRLSRENRVSPPLLLLSALALTVILTAFQVLPTLEYIGQSERSSALPFDQVFQWSLQPVSFLQLLFPHSSSLVTSGERNTLGPVFEANLPLIHSIYIGLVPLCLVIVGLESARDRRFWRYILLVALVLALGNHTPVLPFLYHLAPWVIGKFRYPEKFIFLAHFAAMVLVAEGAERLLQEDRRSLRTACMSAGAFAAIAAGLCSLEWLRPYQFLSLIAFLKGKTLPLEAFVPQATDLIFKSHRLLLILGTFGVILALRHWRIIQYPTACLLLVTLVAADLGSTHYRLSLTAPWSEISRTPPLVDIAELQKTHQRIFQYEIFPALGVGTPPDSSSGSDNGRHGSRFNYRIRQWMLRYDNIQDLKGFFLHVWPTLWLNGSMVYGIGTPGGSDGVARRSKSLFHETLADLSPDRAVALLRLYGVAYLIGPDPLDLTSLVSVTRLEGSPYHTYRIQNPLPEAYLVSRLRVALGDRESLRAVADSTFQPESEALVSELPQGWANDASHAGEASDQVSVTSYQSDIVRLQTQVNRPRFLVLSDSFYPGWEASIDGSPTHIYRTNVLVRGVSVPAGKHFVEFTYRPRSFRIGLGVSAAGLVSLAALAAVGLARRRLPRESS